MLKKEKEKQKKYQFKVDIGRVKDENEFCTFGKKRMTIENLGEWQVDLFDWSEKVFSSWTFL